MSITPEVAFLFLGILFPMCLFYVVVGSLLWFITWYLDHPVLRRASRSLAVGSACTILAVFGLFILGTEFGWMGRRIGQVLVISPALQLLVPPVYSLLIYGLSRRRKEQAELSSKEEPNV